MELENDNRHGLVNQFTRYLICGGLAAAIHLAILIVLVEFFGAPKMLASGFGFVIASIVNITIQRLFIFRSDRPVANILLRYSMVTLFTLALNQILFFIAIEYFAIPYTIAQILVIGILVIVNFGLNRAITFGNLTLADSGR